MLKNLVLLMVLGVIECPEAFTRTQKKYYKTRSPDTCRAQERPIKGHPHSR